MEIEMIDTQESQNFSQWLSRKNGEQLHIFAHANIIILSSGATTSVTLQMSPVEAQQLAHKLLAAVNWTLETT